jgi:hypothetical protein
MEAECQIIILVVPPRVVVHNRSIACHLAMNVAAISDPGPYHEWSVGARVVQSATSCDFSVRLSCDTTVGRQKLDRHTVTRTDAMVRAVHRHLSKE